VDREDEELRSLFTTVGAQEGPPLGFSADGIARRGKRIRLIRRTAAAAGTLVAVAVVTVTVAIATNRPVQPVEPATPPPPVVTTTEDTTPNATETPTTTVTTTITPETTG